MNFKNELVLIPSETQFTYKKFGERNTIFTTVKQEIKGKTYMNTYEIIVVPDIVVDFQKLFKPGDRLYITGYDWQFRDKDTREMKTMYIVKEFNISSKGYIGE